MHSRRFLSVALSALMILITVGAAIPATASPAPVSGCPPCGDGFVQASATHGLDTEVRQSEATVRVHRNDSATWTVRITPTNNSVLDRLAENSSLARAVASDSFGVRYSSDIKHELLSVDVIGGEFMIRYQTHGVAREGISGTHLLTYFRDSPGAYVYTDLGADKLTVVAPPGMRVAHGFGELDDRQMTATELPDTRNGPFVVFASESSATPKLLGVLAVVNALAGVITRNLLLFVAVPGSVIVGGLAGIRRLVTPTASRNPARLGGGVAIGGALLLLGTLIAEASTLPTVTGNLLIGGIGGGVLLALGATVAIPGICRYLSAGWLLIGNIFLVAAVLVVSNWLLNASHFHRLLTLGVAVLPAVVALGWTDADRARRDKTSSKRLFIGIAVAVFGLLVAFAPLTELGGTLFFIAPILLMLAAIGVVVVAVPLYLLGIAGAS